MSPTPVQAILHNPRLPSLPAVAVRVLELTRDENVNFREVAEVIQNDQALSVKIIRTVNSSFFGLSKPCTTINQAIVYLGLDTVKTLVLGFSLVDSIDGCSDHDLGFDYLSYWRRALHSAVAARELATATEMCDPEEAFLAALVQDVGMVALHRAFRDVYLQIIDLTHGNHQRLCKRERDALETDHAEVGAAIAERWHLPPGLVVAIRHHHDAAHAPAELADLVRIVELAGHAAAALEPAGNGDDGQPGEQSHFHRLAADWTTLNDLQVISLLRRITGAATQLASLFKVNIASAVEAEQLMDEAEQLRIEREVTGDSRGPRHSDGQAPVSREAAAPPAARAGGTGRQF